MRQKKTVKIHKSFEKTIEFVQRKRYNESY